MRWTEGYIGLCGYGTNPESVLGQGRDGNICHGGRGHGGSRQGSRLAIRGGAKTIGDAIGPADILVEVDKGLEAVEVVNWGGIGNMFPVALRAILADTTDPKIIEARTAV